MKRREFFGLAAAAAPALKGAAIDVKNIKSRSVKVEIAYKSPHTSPNGLQKTKEGLWIVDETSGPTHWVSLVNFADGKVLWLSGRYDAEVYAFDTTDGHLLAKIPVGKGPHGLCVYPQPGRYSLGHTGIFR